MIKHDKTSEQELEENELHQVKHAPFAKEEQDRLQWFSKVEGALAIAEQDKSLRKNHEQVSWPTTEFIWFHAVWRIPNPGNKLGLPWMIWDMINERNMTQDADVSDTTRYNTYIIL